MLPRPSSQARLSPATRVSDVRAGFACSLLLHILFAILIIELVTHSRLPAEPSLARFLPVDIVPLAERTTAPAPPAHATLPHRTRMPLARTIPSSPHHSVAVARTRPIQDPLETRLKQLARLRQPDSTQSHLENGASDEVATTNSGRTGDFAGYQVRDFLRAQVERRWSLDLKRARNVVIEIHVKVTRDGTVKEAQIVDQARYASDAAWRSVALSARNAVLLSSPLNLPAGYPSGPIDVTLALNARDVTR